MSNLLSEFASEFRVRISRDECNDSQIKGKSGFIAGTWKKQFLVCSISRPTSRRWNFIRNACVDAGMRVHQNGDCEGSLLIDPNNAEHARLVFKYARIRIKRQLSPEVIEQKREQLARNLGR